MLNKRKIINDPVYGFLTIEDDLVFDIISHPFFQRLRRIRQLGFTEMVYPGATHTRFGHALGALYLMNRAVDVLQVKGVDITPHEALSVRLAALLHDIGHGPFSHTSECVIANIQHEALSEQFMQRINDDYGHQLDTAIAIFNDSYHKHFLHQLVSSQLDVDRLDYLSRDSFFTGVCEGIVGTDRIINMLNVSNDELVVDEKGIYSVEKFIISRRLMYWQVYLHKAVIAADALLLSILRRVRALVELRSFGPVDPDDNLLFFLSHSFNEDDFAHTPSLLDRFAQLDDSDLLVAIKRWTSHPDVILSTLASQLINRHFFSVRIADHPFSADVIDQLRAQLQLRFHIDPLDCDYFVNTGILRNHAYDFNDPEIKVLFKNGSCLDISEASDQLDRHFLEKQVTKYYVFFPKELSL